MLDLRLLQQLGSTTGHTVVLGGWPALGRRETGRNENAEPESTRPASVAVPIGIELVNRSWSGDRVGHLPRDLAHAIDDGIRAVLGL